MLKVAKILYKDIVGRESMEKKFYELSVKERWEKLREEGVEKGVIEGFNQELPLEHADLIIENVVGKISLPLGVVRNFKLNGKTYNVPMALEEPSVVAAANKFSKLTLPEGFKGEADESVMIGEIQIIGKDVERWFRENKEIIEELGKELGKPMETYGGGWRGFDVKVFRGRKTYTVLYFYVDVADSMGANTVNTIAESLAEEIKERLGVRIGLKIISNLATKRKVRVRALWRKEVLRKDCEKSGVDVEEVLDSFIDAYELARIDPYRRATNNKGIMNGIDGVALATGQDWRAIEAGAHMYSCIKNEPLASYRLSREGILGEIEIPLAVATVGGAINSLPHAKNSLKFLGVKKAEELAMIMAGIGLANNFAAIYSIVKEGIQKGHMKLHAKNIAILAGAKGNEIKKVAGELARIRDYRLETAKRILEEIRKEK